MRTLLAALVLSLLPFSSQAQNYSDIWWNPSESGWGLTIADHESNLFAVWFTYRADGKPTWFVIPGGTFTNNHTHFVGDVYSTTGPAFSNASFDSARVTATKVGTATLDFTSFTNGTFSYTVSGATQQKAITRQPFGNATPLWGRDVTDIWYNAAESGWGLTLAQHGNNVFGVWFTYDADGQPLWAVMPGVTFNGSSTFTGTLYTTTGPAFSSATFDPSRVTVKQDGTATLTMAKITPGGQCGGPGSATFQTTLRGASRQSTICQQPFGKVAAVPDFADNPAFSNPAAFFAAPANPIKATIATDDSRAVSQLVGTGGGTIVATDGKGNKFTLDIPPGALEAETAIAMTPTTSVVGPRYASGASVGVKLEPDGLVLLDNAILTVDPATPIPIANQVGFAAYGDGSDLHRAPPGPDFSRMQLHVSHFSVWGFLTMSPFEAAAENRFRSAAREEARILDAISEITTPVKRSYTTGARDSDNPPPSVSDINKLMEDYYNRVVKPRLASASAGCGYAGTAFDSLMKFSNYRRSSGVFEEISTFTGDIDTLRNAYANLWKKTPCYYTETASFQILENGDEVTANVTAYWRAVSQVDHVVTYKALQGSLRASWPAMAAEGCSLANPTHPIGEGEAANSKLDIDWDAHTYEGAAASIPTLWFYCADPDVPPIVNKVPVFYLGDLNNLPSGLAKGKLDANNKIGKETRTFPLGTLEYTFRPECAQDDALFCGGSRGLPPH